MKALNDVLQKISRGIFKGFFWFATLLFASLLIMLFCNVISRNLLDGSIAEVEEFSRFVFTWMMFFGISIGVYYRKHLGVEFLLDHYPPKLRNFIKILGDCFTLLLFLILIYYGFIYSSKTMKMLSPILEIPYGYVYLCIPLSSIISAFFCVVNIVDRFANKEEEK